MAESSTNFRTGETNLTMDVPTGGNDWTGLPIEYQVPRWYAAYTSANHEKRIAEQLKIQQVEYFLPLYPSVRQWKDRRVTLQLPLFPGYVFVRMALRDRLGVQRIAGVAWLVGFNGKPAQLPESEMDNLRASLGRGIKAQPHPLLTIGQTIRVKRGPLAGLQGILVRRKNQMRLVVSVQLIQRAMSVEIDESQVEPAP